MSNFYAGIGSRETPPDILRRMTQIGLNLARQGWTLRSGGADGADSAFEAGAMEARREWRAQPMPEIYLPWCGFNNHDSVLFGRALSRECEHIAARNHPRWAWLSDAERKLHSRNTAQVLGANCDSPSAFVLCWTKGGQGGTAQAIRVATHYGVPVYDMGVYSLGYIARQVFIRYGVSLL